MLVEVKTHDWMVKETIQRIKEGYPNAGGFRFEAGITGPCWALTRGEGEVVVPLNGGFVPYFLCEFVAEGMWYRASWS